MSDLFKDIMHTGPYFAMLIGLPGVGKSTFREGISRDAVVMSTDDIIEDTAKWEGKTYDEVWERDIKQATSAMGAAMRAAIKDGANIIHDRTNLSAKRRRGVITQVPTTYFKLALVFETPPAEEHARRLSRPGKTIPEHVLTSMAENFQYPTLEEGWDLITVVPAT